MQENAILQENSSDLQENLHQGRMKGTDRPRTPAMKNEVLCKFLCHNVCVVHQSHVEVGIEPVFWGDAIGERSEKIQGRSRPR